LSDNPANEKDVPAKRGGCPICGKPASPRQKPFCSHRCADVDLQRWLSGAYAIPVADDEPDTDDPLPKDPAL
jgi:uncharacterized protein